MVCGDEQPAVPVKERRELLLAMARHPQRANDGDEQAGTAAAFLCCEPLRGWQQATAREHRTQTDRAHEVAEGV